MPNISVEELWTQIEKICGEQSIGDLIKKNDPRIQDILKLIHPLPVDPKIPLVE